MKKIIILLLSVNLFSKNLYFIDIKKDNGNETIQISKNQYINTLNEIENKQKFKMMYRINNKDYQILDIYKKISKDEEINTNQIINQNKQIEVKQSYKKYIVLIIIISIIYFKFKKKKQKVKKEIKQNIEIEEELLSYKELEEKRKEIYNNLKYSKEIKKEDKKEIYKKLREFKEDIKNKKDIKIVNEKIKKIESEI